MTASEIAPILPNEQMTDYLFISDELKSGKNVPVRYVNDNNMNKVHQINSEFQIPCLILSTRVIPCQIIKLFARQMVSLKKWNFQSRNYFHLKFESFILENKPC